jgi:DNA-binding NarL/FixJ family response regulator
MLTNLSPREREIVQVLVERQCSNKHLARTLGLTEGTIKLHLHNIYTKLGIMSRAQLIVLAITAREAMARNYPSGRELGHETQQG